MSDEAAEIAAELRRHLAWQETDGTKVLWKDPTAAPKPATAQAPARIVAQAPAVALERKPLEQIRTELGDCQRCKLCKGRTQIVFGSGNPKAELMFVGEAPGADEDQQGQPFVGAAGQLLTKMIEAMKFTRDQVYICNVVKWWDPLESTCRHASLSIL